MGSLNYHRSTKVCEATNCCQATVTQLICMAEQPTLTHFPFTRKCLSCDTGDTCTSCSARQSLCSKQLPLAAQMVSKKNKGCNPLLLQRIICDPCNTCTSSSAPQSNCSKLPLATRMGFAVNKDHKPGFTKRSFSSYLRSVFQ